ncbi:MAG: glycoside hydrolase family 13 protein [Flavobacteriaceae bacterium]|nr:glycoside hydrolase family 13 protein [Flavobacteriaceae bacterium]
MKKIFSVYFLILSYCSYAQIERVEPPFWWEGMEKSSIQLMLYGDNLTVYQVVVPSVKGVQVHRVDNPNYLFVDLDLSQQQAGELTINLIKEGQVQTSLNYEIKSRDKQPKLKSFNASDVIYLLIPDRFANGVPSNDAHSSVIEQPNRADKDGRHGGDIKGIIEHLDYLEELGVTALWSTPMCEDNDPKVSYHTYAQSDVYRIDPRFGTNEDYRALADALHQRKMKLIMDYVTNHWGTEHWIIKDLPTPDWIHQFDNYTNTNHRKEIHSDPYASNSDRKELLQGWFVPTMADLNQTNPYVLTYLIQNAIWWIEFARIDGFRVDTFPYNNPKPMITWVEAIRKEYPNFNIVGEGWMHNSIHLSYWQEKSPIAAIQGFDSKLPSVMDFTLNDALVKMFSEKNSYWEHGTTRLYKNLQNDFLYSDINNVIIFAENHDTNRINDYYPDFKNYKQMLSVLMTLRGIPQIYYGSEIGMTGKKDVGDGDIRRDFPGGWPTDTQNAFNKKGRTPKQAQYFNFSKKLIQWRKTNSAIHFGKTLHYTPREDVYVYFRYTDDERVMVVVNNNSRDMPLPLSQYSQGIAGNTHAFEIGTGSSFALPTVLEVPAETTLIIELSL